MCACVKCVACFNDHKVSVFIVKLLWCKIRGLRTFKHIMTVQVKGTVAMLAKAAFNSRMLIFGNWRSMSQKTKKRKSEEVVAVYDKTFKH